MSKDLKVISEEVEQEDEDLQAIAVEAYNEQTDILLEAREDIDFEHYCTRRVDRSLQNIIIKCFGHLFYYAQGSDYVYVWNGSVFKMITSLTPADLLEGHTVTAIARLKEQISRTLEHSAKKYDKVLNSQKEAQDQASGHTKKGGYPLVYTDWVINNLDNITPSERIWKGIKNDTQVKETFFNSNPWLIAMPDGKTYDMSVVYEGQSPNPKVYDSRPEDVIVTTYGNIIQDDVDMTEVEADFDLWFDGDKEAIECLQTIMGYSLLGIQTEQCFFIHKGPGGDGKSQFAQIMEAVFGDYATRVPNNFYSKPKDNDAGKHTTIYKQLVCKRLVLCNEPPRIESDMKPWCGDRVAMTYRLAHSNQQGEFMLDQTIHFFANNLMHITDVDPGTWDRMRIIQWPHRIRTTSDEIGGYAEMRKQDKNYMMAMAKWVFDGCVKFCRNRGFATMPASWINIKEQQFILVDSLESFLKEKTSYGRTFDRIETSKTNIPKLPTTLRCKQDQLRAAYVDYCKQMSEKPLDPTLLNGQLRDKGLEVDSKCYWKDLAVLDRDKQHWLTCTSKGVERLWHISEVKFISDGSNEPDDEMEVKDFSIANLFDIETIPVESYDGLDEIKTDYDDDLNEIFDIKEDDNE